MKIHEIDYTMKVIDEDDVCGGDKRPDDECIMMLNSEGVLVPEYLFEEGE